MSIVSYLKQRCRVVLVFGAFAGIFAASFALYRLPVEAVAYPAGLCVAVGLMIMAGDYARPRRLHGTLQQLTAMSVEMEEALPDPTGVMEANYQQLIRQLCLEQRQERSAMSARYADMMDYYTVWAHQIKTPIAAMRLHLQQEDSSLGRTLSSELMRVEQYVSMVLAYLRLDASSTDYVIREYELDGIVCQAVKRFAGEFIARQLSLSYAPLKTRIVTDEKWLVFVLEQVLSNALKYTITGGVTITMESPRTLCIKDTGIGIAPEDLPRIFEKGFTGENGRQDKKASGIGLYLCQRICANLGHGITAQSVLGQGTTIRINLAQQRLQVE